MMTGALAVTVVALLAMALGPYADYTAARHRVETLAGEQAELEESVESLESERARLEDPRSLEEQARRELGLTRPGEIPYIVVNPPTPEPVPAELADQPAEDASPSLVQQVVDWVAGWTS